MTRKRGSGGGTPRRGPRAYVAALPLSALPELRDILAPLMGAAGSRGTVVMMRLAEEPLGRIDRLVEAGLFGSRSEAAAFLVGAGIEAQGDLFQRIDHHAEELQRVRRSLQKVALETFRKRRSPPASGPRPAAAPAVAPAEPKPSTPRKRRGRRSS